MLKTEAQCSRCGASLNDAADGLCVRCLLTGALTPPEEDLDAAATFESPATLLAKRQFAGYELLDEIARGGMGVVFRARQKKPERVVALKVIAAGELATPRMVERFSTEASAAARLDHPNIVPIYEVGHDDGWHFFSMRLIEGCTLAEKLRGRGLQPEEAAQLMVKVARAVQHAHERGVLHRDLKPNNILLDARGEPHLTDFGLAKMVESSVEMTLSNVVLGTPAYMAPEQAAGGTRDVTVGVDVYGLGAVFYEMLTGRPPFEAPSTHALLRKVAEEDPAPPSTIYGERRKSALRRAVEGERQKKGTGEAIGSLAATNSLSTDLDVICLKCLEKEPVNRYHSAEHLADDVERALRGETIIGRPSTRTQRVRKWVRRNPTKAGLAATGFAALLFITVISLAFNVRLTRTRNFALASEAATRRELISQHLRENARLNGAGHAFNGMLPLIDAWRVEGNEAATQQRIRERVSASLAFSPRLVRLWDAGGTPVQLQFSSNNQRLVAVLRQGAPHAWDLQTRQSIPHPDVKGRTHRNAFISPDGEHILEYFYSEPYAELWNVAAGTLTRMQISSWGGNVAAFSPDGKLVASGGEHVRLWNTTSGTDVEPAITNDTRCFWMTFSPDGSQLITIHQNDQAWRWDLRTGARLNETPLTISSNLPPTFGPDGTRLLVNTTGAVQVLDWASGVVTSSVPAGFLPYEMNISPDARHFAIAGFRDQARDYDVAAGRMHRSPLAHESGANKAVFSPDGLLLATAGFDYELRIVRAANHQLVAPAIRHSALIEALAFSSDSRFLAVGDVDGIVQVWDLETQAKPLLADGQLLRHVANTTDGRWMAAEDADGSLRLLNLETGLQNGEAWKVPENLSQVSIDAPTRYIAGAFRRNGVRVWDFSNRKLLHEISGTEEATRDIRNIVFKPDGSEFATMTPKGLLQRWTASTGKPVGPLMKLGANASFLRWSPDGRWIAAGEDRSVSVFDAQTGAALRTPLRGESRENIADGRFSPDSKRLILAPANNSIEPAAARIYQLPSLKAVGAPLRHGDGVASVNFSADGKLVATGGEDNVARIWRADDGTPIGGALRHPGIVLRVLFSGDGRWLATGCVDGNLRVWDVQRSELFTPLIQVGGATRPLCFSPDGTKLFFTVSGTKEMMYSVSLTSKDLPLDRFQTIAECETGLRADLSQGAVPLSAAELAKKFSSIESTPGPIAAADEMVRWHEQNALIAERQAAWFTAAYHLRRLLAGKPSDAALAARLAKAELEQSVSVNR